MSTYVSIVELGTFVRAVENVLNESELDELKSYLAVNPDAGDLIVGTGGVRKLRWAAQGKGKRGGGRVIYYFHNKDLPLFLITFFTKGVKADLSAKERTSMAKLVKTLIEEHAEARHERR